MKQLTLDEQERIGVCRALEADNKICGTKLVHFVKGYIDYWFCPKCHSEIVEHESQFILSVKNQEDP